LRPESSLALSLGLPILEYWLHLASRHRQFWLATHARFIVPEAPAPGFAARSNRLEDRMAKAKRVGKKKAAKKKKQIARRGAKRKPAARKPASPAPVAPRPVVIPGAWPFPMGSKP
jgi:hypothetical protein